MHRFSRVPWARARGRTRRDSSLAPHVDAAETGRRRLTGYLSAVFAVVVVAVVALGYRPDLTDIAAADRAEARENPPDEVPRAAAVTEVSVEPLAAEVVHLLKVARGDTLMGLLTDEGVPRQQAYYAIEAMSEVFSPRRLKVGQELKVVLAADPAAPAAELVSLQLAENAVRDVRVVRLDDGVYEAEIVDRPTEVRNHRAEGEIRTSLYEAALDAGVPMPVLARLIDIFSYDVDFQREVRTGDSFGLLYETIVDDRGEEVDHGEILVAEMTLSGKQRRYYRFQGEDGRWDYYDLKGQSVRKALLRTPVEGARISSGFGMRNHPILGYSRMHRGVDFAAPTGTPIFAAGDGVIEAAGWNGGYGKYVRIRHNDTFKTAYAHLSRIAKGVTRGQRVQQRQVIGYVGTTGNSTGPHLHYEVHKNGQQTNPLGVKLPTGRTLQGQELQAFLDTRVALEQTYATAPSTTKQLAKAD